MLQIKSILVAMAVLGGLSSAVNAQVTSTFSGNIDGTEPESFEVDVSSCDLIEPLLHFYETFPAFVTETGDYDYQDLSIFYDLDMQLTIYTPTYDPDNVLTNCVTRYDDSGSVALQAGVQYVFVVQPLLEIEISGFNTGDWEFEMTGPGQVIEGAPPPKLSCEGFQFPLDSAVTVKRYNSYPPYFDQPSVLPLTMRLLDEYGEAVYPQDLASPPVVEVLFDGYEAPVLNGLLGPGAVPEELPYIGFGDDGNRFEFDQGFWRFYMGTGEFGATGTYYVAVISGDQAGYQVDPTCVGTFTIVNPFSFGW